MKLTLIVKKGKNGYLIGQLKLLPAVFTQAITIGELKKNIADALEMYLQDVRDNYNPDGEILQEEELPFE